MGCPLGRQEPIGIGSAIGTGSVRCNIRFRSIRDRIGIGYDLLGFDWALLGSRGIPSI